MGGTGTILIWRHFANQALEKRARVPQHLRGRVLAGEEVWESLCSLPLEQEALMLVGRRRGRGLAWGFPP